MSLESKKRKTYFIFPVFNEALNMPQVLGDLNQLEKMAAPLESEVQFVFVDDGSTDSTCLLLEGAQRPNLILLRHSENRGPGAAFQTAFDQLMSRRLSPDDLVITLEGDATSEPEVFARMLTRLSEGDDLILASPYLYGGGFSEVAQVRLILSHMANFLFKWILNIHGLATFSCFYRIYRGQALLRLQEAYAGPIVTTQGFECAAEIILKAVRCRFSISEVPFRVNWSRKMGGSKMRILKTSLGYFGLFFKYRRSSQLKRTFHEASNHRWRKTAIH